ncbi:hypothetical protein MKW98_003487 [Papaver atlanticum]|uniref:Chlororespiratory reduction31 n=1 Tax=Papaver atlanticum TaxID=357466 RepID=A0AAD4T8L3_9MAGN|nr:hypothetical protein MKW98_003487 [Papaver atlanticum]
MASSSSSFMSLPSCKTPSLLQKSSYLGETQHLYNLISSSPRSLQTIPPKTFNIKPISKFNLFEIMGGRGLLNGEKSLQEQLKKMDTTTTEVVSETTPPKEQGDEENLTPSTTTASSIDETASVSLDVPDDAFDKELLGLTGGFPGGEKGLRSFIEKNPPPPKKTRPTSSGGAIQTSSSAKIKPPQLPLLMPGMIAVVKNPKNPFYMYTGIIQRITDGKAGVLFEGGNWDKLMTFQLNELERREKGPPMVNPLSAVLEPVAQEQQKDS